ncbi:MAG: DegT/DnrJ/EryC1/StrS family aminotransferase [Lysobacter sp.]|nr:DegT/DnrJ/EryC1/StrS family aminotransferase [Lysobacter sp.]
MTIPVNDLKRYAAESAGSLTECAVEVLRSGHYVLGPWVNAFESTFADYCAVEHCISVANGTDALELALRAAGIVPGDAVVVAANAAMYGTTAVLAIGADPIFADVVEATALLTADTIRQAIGEATKAPRALIVTHLYGRLADMPEIIEVAKTAGMLLIEDCAQAHGAIGVDGRRAGAYGDIATFSFYPTKNLGALGDGGAVTTNDDCIADRVRKLRQYGWSSKYCNALEGGRNSRLDELQAAFLCRLLPDLERRNKRRREIANRYSLEIRNPGIATPPTAGAEYVAHLYVVTAVRRDALRAHLSSSGVGTDVQYPTPDYRQVMHGDRFARVFLPATEILCGQVLTLPCFPEMFDAEIDAVIAACNAWPG